MIFLKRAVSPVVATALLLVVAVSAVVGFSGWFNEFNSNLFVDVEISENSGFENIKVESIIGDNLYLNSNYATFLSEFKIINSNNKIICEFNKNNNSDFNTTRLLLNFNEDNILDLSGYNNTLNIQGGLTCLNSGIYGNSCEFDGIDDRIEIINDDSISLRNNFTYTAWIKPNNLISPQRKAIISKTHIVFRLHNDNLASYLSGDNGTITSSAAGKVNVSEWIFVSIVISSENIEYYINGEKTIYVLNTLGNIIQNVNNLYIGDQPGTGRLFNGSIDELAIYSKPLTQKEILFLYENKKTFYYEQIIHKGVRKIDLSNCNLTKGEVVNFLAFTENNKIDVEVIVK